MPLATFHIGIAEIFTINFTDGIIIVPPFITNETSWIEFVARYFFLFGHNFIQEPEELGDVMHVLCPNFHTGQTQYLSTEWVDYVEDTMKYQTLRPHFFCGLVVLGSRGWGGWWGLGWSMAVYMTDSG